MVNNYLMGQKPPAFDILYWNNDTTNLPAALHSDYLDIIAGQALEKSGGTQICGYPVDLKASTCDKYVVAGLTDHITPWQGCYRSLKMLGGKSEFVLSSSGHIQSLINPPGNPRSKYYLNKKVPDTAEGWREGAYEQSGTWWGHWISWLQPRSGNLKNAPRSMGNKKFPPQVDAPGTYVHQQTN